MTERDIVERLRLSANPDCQEAADEIERLRKKVHEWQGIYKECNESRDRLYDRLGSTHAENERLRAALTRIANHNGIMGEVK